MDQFKYAVLFLLLASKLSAEPYHTERKVIRLSEVWHDKMVVLSEYKGLRTFCNNDVQRQIIFNLMDEIHYYHDALEEDLRFTTYNHSRRTIKKILKHIDKLESKYHPEDFADFFEEQCSLQYKIEKNSDHYNAGFGTHSYGGKVYVQEVEIHRYLKGLSKRIFRIKEHVENFYVRRTVWER